MFAEGVLSICGVCVNEVFFGGTHGRIGFLFSMLTKRIVSSADKRRRRFLDASHFLRRYNKEYAKKFLSFPLSVE